MLKSLHVFDEVSEISDSFGSDCFRSVGYEVVGGSLVDSAPLFLKRLRLFGNFFFG